MQEMVEAEGFPPTEPDDADVPGPIARNGLVRWLLIAGGMLCVGLAVLGVLLPLLPTTPFLLLAAICFARSSDRLHRWLHGNPLFGEYLRRYREGEGMSRKAKASVLVFLWLSLGYSATAMPEHLSWLRPVILACGLIPTTLILRIRTYRPGP